MGEILARQFRAHVQKVFLPFLQVQAAGVTDNQGPFSVPGGAWQKRGSVKSRHIQAIGNNAYALRRDKPPGCQYPARGFLGVDDKPMQMPVEKPIGQGAAHRQGRATAVKQLEPWQMAAGQATAGQCPDFQVNGQPGHQVADRALAQKIGKGLNFTQAKHLPVFKAPVGQAQPAPQGLARLGQFALGGLI